ncbi:unnamed protein product, partial [Leptidea sinapis]
MEVQGFPCPLCCDETFESKQSLTDHLHSINSNIVCPLCKGCVFSLENLIVHLNSSNCSSDNGTGRVMYTNYTDEGKNNIIEYINNTQSFSDGNSSDNNRNNTDLHSNSPSSLPEDTVYLEYVDKEIIKTGIQTQGLSKKSEENYVIFSDNESMLNEGTFVTKQNEDGTVSFTMQDTKPPDDNELHNSGSPIMDTNEVKLGNETPANLEELYTCNACGISFTSVSDHIATYHSGQDVVVE